VGVGSKPHSTEKRKTVNPLIKKERKKKKRLSRRLTHFPKTVWCERGKKGGKNDSLSFGWRKKTKEKAGVKGLRITQGRRDKHPPKKGGER